MPLEPSDGIDWRGTVTVKPSERSDQPWRKQHWWMLGHLSPGWLHKTVRRFCLPLNTVHHQQRFWSHLCELNRTSRMVWKRGEKFADITEQDFALGSNRMNESRLASYYRSLLVESATDFSINNEYSLTEIAWNQIPKIFILLCSPIFWSCMVRIKECFLPSPESGWKLHSRFEKTMEEANQYPDRFWQYWRKSFVTQCLMTHDALLFRKTCSPQMAQDIQFGCLIRMSWYLSSALAASVELNFKKTLIMPEFRITRPTQD